MAEVAYLACRFVEVPKLVADSYLHCQKVIGRMIVAVDIAEDSPSAVLGVVKTDLSARGLGTGFVWEVRQCT